MCEKNRFLYLLTVLLLCIQPFIVSATEHNIVQTLVLPDGRLLDRVIVPGHPPEELQPTVRIPETDLLRGINVIGNVPAFDWCYGCSATSGAMMAGHYDRVGYINAYAGPANGGLCPLDNSVWGGGESPLAATHQGYDALATRGHVDDYYVSYGSAADDPYITGGWTQHSYADCTADFMKTSQSAFSNRDGSTKFYYWPDGSPYSGTVNDDGGYGLALFFQSRGYTVLTRFNQYIYGHSGNTLGFSFVEFMQEIDAGRPVLIHLDGHTMLGFGYDSASSTIYIHDTWDYNDHSMTWGGSYSGMDHVGVSCVRLDGPPDMIFEDGFESAGTSAWSNAVP